MAQTGIFEALQQVQAENALLKSQGLDPQGFGALIQGGDLTNLFGGDQQVPAPQQDLQQVLTDQFDPRSIDPVGVSGRASGQTGAESLRFGTPPPDLQPAITPRSTQSQEQVTRSLARLQTLDPTGASSKFALGLIQNRNKQDLAAAKAKMDEVFKETTNLLRVKDPVGQERQIIQTIRERASRGIASPALQKILELPIERRVVGLEQRKTIATDVKTLATNEQKELDREQKKLDRESKERIALGKIAKFENVLDAKGNVIAQRNTVTGELKKSPIATGGQAEKATFTKGIGIIIQKPDGTFAQSVPVLDSRTGEIVNKLSPIPGQPVSRLGETPELETLRAIREKRLITRARGEETRIRATINDGITAAEGLGVIKRSLKLMKNIKTGGIEGAKIRFRKFLGVEGADEAELTANLLRTVLAQLRPTFGAAFTEAEGARLERIEAGIGSSTAGNIRLLKQLETMINREARRGLKAAKRIKDDFAIEEIDSLLKFKISTPVEDVKTLSDADLLKGF